MTEAYGTLLTLLDVYKEQLDQLAFCSQHHNEWRSISNMGRAAKPLQLVVC